MRIKQSIGGLLALALAVGLSLPPAAAESAVHIHTWREDWAMDDYRHWHGCTDPSCRTLVPSQAAGYSYHRYDDSRDAVCNDCGWVRAVDPGHTHTWGTAWNTDSQGHWRACTDPDCPGVVSAQAKDYGVHVYDSGQDPDCNICLRSRYVNPYHTHVWGTDWSGNDTHHWYVCTAPGCPGVAPSEGKGYEPHVYDSELDPDCSVCGRFRVVLPSDGEPFQPPLPDADLVTVGRGVVSIRPVSHQKGDRVTVILTPAEHYTAGSLTVTDQNGGTVETAGAGAGVWSFTCPGEQVRMKAVFLPAYSVCPKDGSCPLAACGDLSPDRWYHDGIHYCLDWGLMGGYDRTRFVPGDGLTGGMAAQILYNMAGRPELPAKSGYEPAGSWYDSAMAWAVGAGVMNTEGGGLFTPTEAVTREQLAVMLWRYAARPSAPVWSRSFPDAGSVTPWMAEAVRWAVDRDILHGRDDGSLDPGGRVTRAEAAAMLVRFQEDASLAQKHTQMKEG